MGQMSKKQPVPAFLSLGKCKKTINSQYAFDVLIEGANHFAVANPLDETTGRFFLDMEMTRPAEEIRNQIAELVLSFINKKDIKTEHIIVRKK